MSDRVGEDRAELRRMRSAVDYLESQGRIPVTVWEYRRQRVEAALRLSPDELEIFRALDDEFEGDSAELAEVARRLAS